MSPRHKANVANDTRGYVSGVAMEKVVVEAVTAEALQAAYEERFRNAKPQTEYNAAHILVATAEEAEAINTSRRRGRFCRTCKDQVAGYRFGQRRR